MPNLGTQCLIRNPKTGVGWAAGGGQVGRHPLPCAMARWWTHRFFVFDVRGKHLLLSLTYFLVFQHETKHFRSQGLCKQAGFDACQHSTWDLRSLRREKDVLGMAGSREASNGWTWGAFLKLQKFPLTLGHVSQGFLLSTCQAWRAFRIASGRSRHAVRRPGKAYRKVWNGWCSPARRTEPWSTTTQWASEHCGWHTCHGRSRIGSIKILLNLTTCIYTLECCSVCLCATSGSTCKQNVLQILML